MIALVFYLIALLAITLAAAMLPRRAIKLWRAQDHMPKDPPFGWRFGLSIWRGWVRATPIMSSIAALGMLLASWDFLLLTSIGGTAIVSDSSWRARIMVGLLTGIGLVLLALLCGFVIVVFNRPKFLVPPHLRKEDGALEYWLRGERRS